jgi:polyisoprenoid-binding protein YceI
MKYLTLFTFMLILALSACTSPATNTPAPTATEKSEPAQPTHTPVEEPYPAPRATESGEDSYPAPEVPIPTAEAYPQPEADAPAAGVIVFKIVPAESSLSYEVGETFINQNNKFNTAIGVSTDISGEISIDPENPQNSSLSPITVNISKFKSDSSRRDSTIQNSFLESSKYPLVTFTPTEIINFPENPQPGESYSFQVVGDTTIRETTLPLTFDVTVSVTEEQVNGTATTTFLMSDFGFGPISLAGILNTEDEVKINFDFVARP